MGTRVRVAITLSEAEHAVLKNVAFRKRKPPTTQCQQWVTARLWQEIDANAELYEIWRAVTAHGQNVVAEDGR